jgi:hypothetical protein
MALDQGEEEGEHGLPAGGAGVVLMRFGEAEMGAVARIVEGVEERDGRRETGGGRRETGDGQVGESG